MHAGELLSSSNQKDLEYFYVTNRLLLGRAVGEDQKCVSEADGSRCRTERRTVSYHVLNDFADYGDDVDALEKEGRVPGRPYMLLEQKLRA
jgi:ribosomal protein L7Ae-like RNA K-turn-binding protein